MATLYWRGTAPAIAQVQTVTVTGFDASTTYSILIGTLTVSVAGDTDAATTAEVLKDAFNASTRAEKSGIGATQSGAVITLTGTAGLPFTATASAAGGTGTIGTSVTTAASGPNFWSAAANWSTGAVPANNDDVVIDGGPNICWGLDQSAVTLDSLRVTQEFTGRIGLNRRAIALSANALNTSDAAPEYRSVYLDIGADACYIGEQTSASLQPGSPRIMLDLGTAASAVTVYRSGSASADTGMPAIRMLCDSSSTTLDVRSAAAGLGIAVDRAGEASEFDAIDITDSGTATRVSTGDGVTIGSWRQRGGNNLIRSAATIATVRVDGGECRTEGGYTITALTVTGGAVVCNNAPSAGNAVTTLNANGGATSGLGSGASRTWATVNLNRGGSIAYDSAVVSITTLNGRLNATG